MDKSNLDASKSYEIPWKTKPYFFKDDKNASSPQDFESYKFKDGDSLLTIAGTLSRPWKEYTWQELAAFNWGTSTLADVNYYLDKCCGCKTATPDDKTYKLSATDAPGTVWLPKVRRAPSIRFRSPSKQDIGHVALDDESNQHINTLIIPPVYALHLELGDIDGLFDALPSPIGNEPWKLNGVQQRLQAIGCLYVPMGMTKARRDKAAEACWKYYKKVHTKPDPRNTNNQIVPSDDDLKVILVKEVRNNILSIVAGDHLTAKGEILRGGLPRSAADTGGSEECAMIRLPGGYRNCWPRAGEAKKAADYFRAPNATDADKKYDYNMYGDRFECEKAYYDDNPLLGKVPIVATVWRQRLDGKWEPAEGASVYFQLVDPTQPDKNPLRAPELRKIEMDYAKDWQRGELDYTTAPFTLVSPATWAQVKQAALEVIAEANAQERERIITRHAEAAFNWTHPINRNNMKRDIRSAVQYAQGHRPPYTIDNVGPKKFVDPLTTAPTSPDEAKKDPQRYNCSETYGGKRGLPVANNIFETGTARQGLHSTRDKDHADYGTLETATAVTPTGDDHKHAVKAVTNDKGHAGVIFAPARMGGDTYRIRAYVGPPTLDFAGTDPAGPVVETGTMTVWRNIRLCGFYRYKVPRSGAGALTVSNTVQGLFNNSPDSPVKSWAAAQGKVTNVAMDNPNFKKGVVRRLAHNKRMNGASFNANYRPIPVDYLSLVDVFRRAYCELILDVDDVTEITSGDYTKAVEAARDRARRSGEVTKAVDWDHILLNDPTSPWFLTVRSRKDYNDGKDDTKAPDDLDNADMPRAGVAILRHGMRGVGESFTRDGFAPGISLLHVQLLTNAHLVWQSSGMNYGGIGLANGFAVLVGAWTSEEAFPIEGVATHEGGHCLFHIHAPPNGPGHEVEAHQENPDTECMCVMSYRGSFGDYCGRCTMMLRGWHSKRKSAMAGV